MADRYLPGGWVNAALWYDDPAPFIVAVGGRGTGKTYGALLELLKRKERFLYMRRKQDQIDLAKQPAFNPFGPLNSDEGANIITAPLGKNSCGFYHHHLEADKVVLDGEPVGVGVALSTVGTVRGINSLDKTVLLFDEFIPERSERRTIKNEGEAFLNAYETFNRNRELLGERPLKAILLSNTNGLNSDILEALGIMGRLEKVVAKEQTYSSNGLVAIYSYPDSPVSERKSKTVLYNLKNGDFEKMALKNTFPDEDFAEVESRPLKEYQPLATIAGLVLWKHKNGREYYVTEGTTAPREYRMNEVDKAAFCHRYAAAEGARLYRRLAFSSATVKIRWCRIWGV